MLKFNAGRMDATELLAKAGASRSSQCEGCFYIGLHRLAEGKRADAKTWFTKSVETGVVGYDEYMLSRDYLACIDDPSWLPWCVEKK